MEKATGAFIDVKRDGVADLTGHVHQLPCCIKYNGSVSVSHHFKPKHTGREVDGLPVEESYFRGRKLERTTISRPDGYCGFVLGSRSVDKKNSDISVGNSECWKTNAVFQNITYWNHDCIPSQNDDFMRTFHWLTVAKALHNPVTPEDLASTSISL